MSFIDIFVRLRVLAYMLSAAILLFGLIGLRDIGLNRMPNVSPPVVTITTVNPGASPEIMAATVATPLERALGRIAGVTEMTSNSSLGQTRVVLQFDISRSIDCSELR